MGSIHQKEVAVNWPSNWAVSLMPRTMSKLKASDMVWNYIWALIYNRKMWVEIPTLAGTKLTCGCLVDKYCHRHVLRAIADNPMLGFDLQSKIVLPGITQVTYDKNPDAFPEAKKVLQQLWLEAGFARLIHAANDEPVEQVTIGQDILDTMRSMGDSGTFDPDQEER